jgi:hypothetical protein
MLLAALKAWYTPPAAPTQPGFVAAKPIATLAAVPTVAISLPATTKLQVLPKEQVVAKLPALPAEITTNPTQQITATATAPASTAGTQIVSTLNTQTGITTIYTKPIEPKLFELVNLRRIGAGYGLSNGGQTAKVFGEWSFLRVGNAYVGVQAEMTAQTNSAVDARGLLVMDYRF